MPAPQADVIGRRGSPRVLDPGNLGLMPAAELRQRPASQPGILADFTQASAESLPGLPGTR